MNGFHEHGQMLSRLQRFKEHVIRHIRDVEPGRAPDRLSVRHDSSLFAYMTNGCKAFLRHA